MMMIEGYLKTHRRRKNVGISAKKQFVFPYK